jgi:UDP-N-acetylglucosamine 4,6-dehydratase (inverting)
MFFAREESLTFMEQSNILVTGGTGSFGRAFVARALKSYANLTRLVVYSRDEMKQWEMMKEFDDPRLRFFIGDVRDRERLKRAFTDVDLVIHAAATKIVPTAEKDPFECIKTNVNGAMNVVDAALDAGVKAVVALSTDKASSPINLYGASKLVSDKIFVAANNYSGSSKTKFSVVRYGNVMASRGSVIPHFLEQKRLGKKLTVTDKRMTRFMISLDQAIDMVEFSSKNMMGGETYVKKIPSMNIADLAQCIDPGAFIEIGIRPGEKLHEEMISQHDAPFTFDCSDHFVIVPSFVTDEVALKMGKGGSLVEPDFSYDSASNMEWMSEATLSSWIQANALDKKK